MNDILSIVANNPALIDALKEVLLAEFKTPLSEAETLSDEQIGQKVRARLFGKKAVDEAFKKIAKYRTSPAKPEKDNPAR